ncbi:MAG: hypothetical protein B0D92_06835 [Spirochaeta sp. LUC14_002_19_P3]|nr:MAG: hypothetical protein B0D92_06835 [Spirochaeta sp. LUC14_002_19_P3]
MKKLFIAVLFGLLVCGIAAAGDLDFHVGAGYHSSYFGNIDGIPNYPDTLASAKAMPLGISAYAGIGFGMFSKLLNIGIEFSPSWDFNLDGYKMSNFALQGRAYVKLKFIDLITAAVIGGYSINLAGSPDDPGSFAGNPLVGVRVSVAIVYAEYIMNLRSAPFDVAKHEIGVGFAIFR